MPKNSPLLSINDLSIAFHQDKQPLSVVKNVSFDINPCETVALVGESGSGKSLTAHAIMRLLPYPSAFHPSGKIHFDNKDLLALPLSAMREIRGNSISMIFQEPMTALNPLHTVEKQLSEMIYIRHKISQKKCREKVLTLLQQVHLPVTPSQLNAYPHQLSGGQRQRVMIAMALANHPQLLIADEPTTALDVTVQKSILELLQELQQEYRMSILLITHDLGVVNYMADRVLVMNKGKLIEQGEAQALLQQPEHNDTKRLINSQPKGHPVELNHKIDDLPIVMSTQALCVNFPKSKPLWGRCKDFFHALKDINIQLAKGSTLGVVGESGSGKSTLALAMMRLITSTGDITLNGQSIASLKEKQLRPLRTEMQIVFQDPFASLSPRMSAKQIISEGLHLHKALKKEDIDDSVDNIMREVGLDPATQHRYPHEFSGGQRQRIAIARALILNPSIIFLDEPTSALDRTVQVQVIELLRVLQQKRKLSYIFISHDIHVIKSLSHRIIVMKAGKIVENGDTNDIMTRPSHAYTQTLLASTLS